MEPLPWFSPLRFPTDSFQFIRGTRRLMRVIMQDQGSATEMLSGSGIER